jgi:hypothetical protein
MASAERGRHVGASLWLVSAFPTKVEQWIAPQHARLTPPTISYYDTSNRVEAWRLHERRRPALDAGISGTVEWLQPEAPLSVQTRDVPLEISRF